MLHFVLRSGFQFKPASGTAVVAVYTPNRVVLGADSLAITKVTNTRRVGCKIFQFGSVFMAMAGIHKDQGASYYPETYAKNAAESGGSIKDIADRFSRVELKEFGKYVSEMRMQDPHLFEDICIRSESCEAQVIFVGSQNHTAALSYRAFETVVSSGQVQVRTYITQDCPGPSSNCPNPFLQIVSIGYSREMNLALIQDPHYFQKYGVLESVKKLINVAIKAHPLDVGPPISVLTVDGNSGKASWASQSQGECPAIKQ
jgi:hypothetical protein